MKKVIFLLIIIIGGSLIYFRPFSPQHVQVIAVHHSDGVIDVLVDGLPASQLNAIKWWQTNKQAILAKYKIPITNNDLIKSVTFFKFGKGYQEQEEKDRLCFDDMPPPRNCIDKLRLMSVSVMRDDSYLYRFHQGVYIEKEDGRLIKKK